MLFLNANSPDPKARAIVYPSNGDPFSIFLDSHHIDASKEGVALPERGSGVPDVGFDPNPKGEALLTESELQRLVDEALRNTTDPRPE